MTSEQILLVQQSWRMFRSMDPQVVGDLFYSKLFLDHPELRRMFPADMTEQYAKLMEKFNILVARLERFDDLKNDIAAMAERHVGYGVVPQQYEYVGAAFLWTLQQGLGADWTPALEAAWIACYTGLTNEMLKIPHPQPGKSKSKQVH